ncbi:MAG: hypothetical protein ACK4VI_02615 [Alphaproteobacteria bacterium]
MSLSPNFNAADRTYGNFQQRVEKLFSGKPIEADFVLNVVRDFSNYDLGPHSMTETKALAALLREQIASGQITMDNEHGAADVLNEVLSSMEKFGDVPKNYLAQENDRILRAILSQPDTQPSEPEAGL